jgi:hypothetical protein
MKKIIIGYDHHCPFTSKCIGSGNLCPFYVFLLFAGLALMSTCLSVFIIIDSASRNN